MIVKKSKRFKTYFTFYPSNWKNIVCTLFVVPVLFYGFSILIAMLNFQHLPNSKSATVPHDQFSSERAMNDLKELTVEIGTRLIGTKENRKTLEWLKDKIKSIQHNSTVIRTIIQIHSLVYI
jgi:hypothetical protein